MTDLERQSTAGGTDEYNVISQDEDYASRESIIDLTYKPETAVWE